MSVIEFRQGEILYDTNFIYSATNQSCDKLLLVLNSNHAVLDDVVVVPCTSGADTTGLNSGCNPDGKVFFVDTKIGYYDPPTVIQFEFITHIDGVDVVEWIGRGSISRQNKTVSGQELGWILNCLKQIKEDIPTVYYDIIFPWTISICHRSSPAGPMNVTAPLEMSSKPPKENPSVNPACAPDERSESGVNSAASAGRSEGEWRHPLIPSIPTLDS